MTKVAGGSALQRVSVTIAATLLVAAMFVLVAPSASAAVNCVFDDPNDTLAITLTAGDSATLGLNGSNVVLVNGNQTDAAPCSLGQALSTADIDTITVDVTGTGGDSVTIDQSNPFPAAFSFDVDLGGGNDSLTVEGRAAADTIFVGAGGINLDADEMADDVDVLVAGVESISVNGNNGADTISGAGGQGTGAVYAGALTLQGNAGGDSLTGGADTLFPGVGTDNDTVDCGASTNDTVSYAGVATGLSINLNTTSAQATGAGSDTITNCENVTGGSGADVLTGTAAANTLIGGPGADTLIGGAGDDSLQGTDGDDLLEPGVGNDVVTGGNQIDTVSYVDVTTGVVVNLSLTVAQNTGAAGNDTITTVENATGGAGGDLVTGSTAANRLDGGDGDDTLVGGDGDDALVGGNGSDRVDYSTATAGVTLDLTVGTASGQGADTLTTVENVTGTAFGDSITGSASANAVASGAGDDLVKAGDGADTVNGGDGTDTVSGGGGSDRVKGGSGDDSVKGGGGNDDLAGGKGNDAVKGGKGNDVLKGAAGNDTLAGGKGNDDCSGGPGTDSITGCEH
jgi:Ca2+-binding RTX toxin-like protein